MSTTITDRYLMHPPAASGYAADGDPLDSGTAHHVHHDVTILQRKNTRLIAHAVGPGEIDSTSDDWTDVLDATDPGASGTIFEASPWVRERCGWVCGPIPMAHTRLGTSPAGYYPRKVRVVVQADKSADAGTTLTILAALTPTTDPPSVGRTIAEDHEDITDADAGPWTSSLDLSPADVVRPTELWTCRPSTATDPAQVSLAPVWVWVGWLSECTGTPDRIDSISVFEVPE